MCTYAKRGMEQEQALPVLSLARGETSSSLTLLFWLSLKSSFYGSIHTILIVI